VLHPIVRIPPVFLLSFLVSFSQLASTLLIACTVWSRSSVCARVQLHAGCSSECLPGLAYLQHAFSSTPIGTARFHLSPISLQLAACPVNIHHLWSPCILSLLYIPEIPILRIHSLPETRSLPSAKYRALGKEKHTVNASFAERQALGKEKQSAKNTLPSVGRSAKEDTRQASATQLTASFFAECHVTGTRQRDWLRHSAKCRYFFSLFCPFFFYCHPIFSSTTYVI
jgi:hypothetical protein